MNECSSWLKCTFLGYQWSIDAGRVCNVYIYMYNRVVVPRYLLLFGYLFAKLLYFV